MQAYVSSGADFEHMFNLAPVSLWLEDYSALKALFQRWREEGVDDLEAYLRDNPSLLAQCSAALRVLQVNQRTLDLLAAPDQATLVAQLGQIFRDDMHHSLVRELVELWEGRLEYSNESVNYALDGRRLDVRVKVALSRRVLRPLRPRGCQFQASGGAGTSMMSAQCTSSAKTLWPAQGRNA